MRFAFRWFFARRLPGRRLARLKCVADGFDILYPGFPWISLRVQWAAVLMVRTGRQTAIEGVASCLEFSLRPGKVRAVKVSTTWPGFAEICQAAERALPGAVPNWVTYARVGQQEVELFRRAHDRPPAS